MKQQTKNFMILYVGFESVIIFIMFGMLYVVGFQTWVFLEYDTTWFMLFLMSVINLGISFILSNDKNIFHK